MAQRYGSLALRPQFKTSSADPAALYHQGGLDFMGGKSGQYVLT